MHTWFLLLAIAGAVSAQIACDKSGTYGLDGCKATCPEERRNTVNITCSDAGDADKAVVVWVQTEKAFFQVDLKFTNATGTYNPISQQDISSQPLRFGQAVVGRSVEMTLTDDRTGSKPISYNFTSIYCTAVNFNNTGLKLTWDDPAGAAGLLTYQVFQDGKAAAGSLSGNTFDLTPQCTKTSSAYTLVSTSTAFSTPLTCVIPAAGVSLVPSQPISAPTGLAILSASASTSATAASLSFNATWKVPAQVSGCSVVNYTGRLTNAAGVSVTVNNLAVVVSGSDVYLAQAWSVENPNFGTGLFTLEITANTESGDSPAVSATFSVDPCASTCSPSGPSCAFSCECVLPSGITYELQRSYTCQLPSLIAGFFGAEVLNLTGGAANVTSGFSNATGSYTTFDQLTAPKIFPVTGGILNSSTVQFNFGNQEQNVTKSFWARSRTFGCKVVLQATGLELSWTAPPNSNDLTYTVYQNGKEVRAASAELNFTATPDCNNVGSNTNFTVLSTLGWGVNLPCAEESNSVEVSVNPTPTAPTGLVVKDPVTQMTEQAAHLFFNLSWAAPVGQLCPVNYTARVTSAGFDKTIALNTQTVGSVVSVVDGVTIDGFALSNAVVNVTVTVDSLSGSATSAVSTFTSQDLCANACQPFAPATSGCHVQCSCRGPSFANFNLARNFACGDIFGGAGFFWSNLTLDNSEASLTLNFTNGTSQTAFSGQINQSKFFDPLATTLLSTDVSIDAKTLASVGSRIIDFESHAIGCVPTLVGPTGNSLTITWTAPSFSDNYLTYLLWRDGQPMQEVEGNSYTAQPQCNGNANFTLQTKLKGFGLTCPSVSATVNVPLSFLPEPGLNLAVADVSSTSTNITFSPSWSQPTSLGGCNLSYYSLRVVSDDGQFTSDVNLTSADVTIDDKGTVTVPSKVTLTGTSVNVNSIFTLYLIVVTPRGQSFRKQKIFTVPGYLCSETCKVENKRGTSCSVDCTCAYPTNQTALLTRTFTCNTNATGFFFVSEAVNFVDPVGTFNASYNPENGITVPLVNAPNAIAFNFTNFLYSSAITFSLRPANASTNNQTFSLKAASIPCVPTVQVDRDAFKLSWTIPASAAPYLNYHVFESGKNASGTFSDDKMSFTLTPQCNKIVNLTVQTSLASTGLNCLHGAPTIANFALGKLPSPVTDLTIVSPAVDVNATANQSTVSFNVSWTAPANVWGCAEVKYYLAVNVSGSTQLYGSFVSPTASETTLALPFSFTDSQTLDANALYTVAVYVSTDVGISEWAVQTFQLGQSGGSSDSGLSNTVIAGIAVGATIGVVAIALIVYKCMSSRRDYMPIGGSGGSGGSNV